MLLHGLGGDLDQLWGVTDGVVGGRLLPVMAPDARGHGLTDLGEVGTLSFELLGQDVVDLVDHLQLRGPLVLVGVSMGAATAIRVALDHPDRVAGLVLVRPAWLHEPLPSNAVPLAEIGALLARVSPSEGRALFEASERYRQIKAISASTAASLLAQFDKPLARQRARRLIEIPRCSPYASPVDLEAIDVPALVVGAWADPTHPLALAQELSRALPRGRLAVIASRDLEPERNRAQLKAAVAGFMAEI